MRILALIGATLACATTATAERQSTLHKSFPTSAFKEYDAAPQPQTKKRTGGNTTKSTSRTFEAKLDGNTTKEGSLDYDAVFYPSVVPYKRLKSFRQISDKDSDPSIDYHEEKISNKSYKNASTAIHKGETQITLTPGKKSVLPSTAPNMLIKSIRSEPSLTLQAYKDNANNFYVASKELQSPLSVWVTYEVLTPTDFFLETSSNKNSLAALSIPRQASPLPSKLQKEALNAARHLGLTPKTPRSTSLHRLIQHHRLFKATSKDLSGPVSLSAVFYGQRGVCRHRSYSFWVVARALGIDVQYVTNEAHAWVEVRVSEQKWRRIDLGGDADTLTVHNARAGLVSHSLLNSAVTQSGYKKVVTKDAQGPLQEQPPSTSAPTTKDKTAPTFSYQDMQSAEAQGGSKKPFPILTLTPLTQKQFVTGGMLDIEGAFAFNKVQTFSGLPVDLFLVSVDQTQNHYHLGRLYSNEKGEFDGAFQLPKELPVGQFSVVATSPGNDTFAPSVSEQ